MEEHAVQDFVMSLRGIWVLIFGFGCLNSQELSPNATFEERAGWAERQLGRFGDVNSYNSGKRTSLLRLSFM